jgi:D-sedoheptulose 7-phosphate isomerase
MTGGSSGAVARADASERVAAVFERRTGPARDLTAQAGEVARAAHAMAVRFHGGGKLVVFGTGAASADAQHVAVEFIHPVIVGKRALPAISLTSDAATITAVASREGVDRMFAHQIRYLAEPADIALGIAPDGSCESVRSGLATAGELGMLTIVLAGRGSGGSAELAADHRLTVASDEPRVIKELQVTIYHLLWELVHVFFEQPSVLGPGVVA